MWFSGLRGAIAFALAIRSLHDFEGGNGDVILTLTLIYALITIIFIAGGITPLLLAFDVIDNGEIMQEDRGDKCS